MAHLTEHVMGRGSKKYPKFIEDAMKFCLTYHHFTTEEATNFSVAVPNEMLEDSLERYSSVLMDPLFDENAVEKERKVIDLEFRDTVVHWGNRLELVLFDLMVEGHPCKTFGSGNEKSLPEDKNQLKEKIRKFHQHYYPSVPMYVCMHANYELDKMQVNHFLFAVSSVILSFLWLIIGIVLTCFRTSYEKRS